MSNQYPQQPYGQYPQQPYGQPPFQPQPQPPKKPSAGKIVGLGCLGVVGLFILIAAVAGVTGGNSDSGKSSAAKPAATANGKPADSDKPASGGKGRIDVEPEPEPEPEKPEKKTVIFKVWGTAPAGALGTLDITYGSDSDNRDGAWKNGKFTTELPLDDDALYYTVMAQLQGSGDIQCSVTVDGHTEKGHASGGYNICHAQANSGLLGGWN